MRRIILSALLTLSLMAVAQEARTEEYPLTPDPASCDADPINIEALVVLAATPAPAATQVVVPAEGRIASRSVQNELMEVVVGSVACTNANQPLRALSFFTVDYLLTRISDEPAVTLGHLEAASTRDPAVATVEDRVTIEAVEMATAWQDGAEVVLLWSSGEDQLVRVWLRFGDVDGDWKINDVIIDDSR